MTLLPPRRGRHWQRAVGFFSPVIGSTGATSMNMNSAARMCAGSGAGLCREKWASPLNLAVGSLLCPAVV